MSYFLPIKSRIVTAPFKKRRRQEASLQVVFSQTTSELACEFAVEKYSRSNVNTLAMQISWAKRRLIFSAAEFIRTWLDRLPDRASWALDSYYTLAQKLPGVLTITMLIQLAERTWLSKQWQTLLLEPSAHGVAKEYLEAMILESIEWINQVCQEEKERSFFDGLALQMVLEILHDPAKLIALPMEKRYEIAMKLLEEGDVHNDALQKLEDAMAIKSRLWNEPPTPVARHFALWFAHGLPDHLVAWVMGKPSWTRLVVFSAVCHIWAEMSDLSQATSLIDHLNDAVKTMFSSSSSSTFSISMLAILLLLVQTAILSFGDLIGMRYQKWIQHMFLDPQTSCFKATVNTKKSMDLLVSSLEAMIPGENPSVLQFHGKALSGKQHFPFHNYVSLVKARLMEHGLDHSLRQYPSSLQIPLQLLQYGQQPDQRIYSNSTLTTAGNPSSHHVEDEISRILEEYEKTRLIPKSLWEDTIFRPRWFRATFIPAITLLPERLDVRDALMAALMDKKRINEDTYAEYLEKRTV